MKKMMVVFIAVIAVMVAVLLGLWYMLNSPTTYSGTLEPITIGVPPNEASALIYIAEERGFFADNGINATIKNCSTALEAINAMKNGEADISVSAEYPIVTEVFKKENISVIGCIDKHDTTYIIGRKDRGIENVSDLMGKRIGVSRGTIADFYVGRFLDLHDINLQNVTIADIPQSQSVDAITNGSVDATLIRQAYDIRVDEFADSNHVVWPVQNSQATYMVMTCRDDWAAAHPEPINRFLKSLVLAEDYYSKNPAEAKSIIQKWLQYDDAYMATVWPDSQFSLSLDGSLITAMEDEGRWMIANNLTNVTTIPDYWNYVYTKGLLEVDPEAVNIR
jgi:NitT/TauT family transport system substrate-binding protein